MASSATAGDRRKLTRWSDIVFHALRSGDREMASAVFDAADQPGRHRSWLARHRAGLGLGLDVDLDA